MGSIVLDSGVVVALLDAGDAHHSAAVRTVSLLRAGGATFQVSAVSVMELLVGGPSTARRRRAAEGFIKLLGPHGVIAVDERVARTGARIRSGRRSVTTPDALIAASAEVCGAEKLLTTDRKLARLPGTQYVGTR